jgi:hypothetical protein
MGEEKIGAREELASFSCVARAKGWSEQYLLQSMVTTAESMSHR